MPNNESQCYFVQLQIDTYLDNELGEAQHAEFHSHISKCTACAEELRFAHMLHESVITLPQLDCDDSVLEPAHRLGTTARTNVIERSWWRDTLAWLDSMPVFARYALPAMLIALILVPFVYNGTDGIPGPSAPLVATQEPEALPAEYSPAEIQKALADLNLAMQYLNEVGLRTEVMIGDRFLVTPVRDSINASFNTDRDRTPVVPRDDTIF